jgi:ferredoxin-type protein NapH
MKLGILRRITLAAAFVLIVVGLILNTGTGTLSSFGWQVIATICPLGSLESLIASKTIFPRALIVLGLAIIFVFVFGKVFCSWLCPISPVRNLLDSITRRLKKGVAKQEALPAGKQETLPANRQEALPAKPQEKELAEGG